MAKVVIPFKVLKRANKKLEIVKEEIIKEARRRLVKRACDHKKLSVWEVAEKYQHVSYKRLQLDWTNLEWLEQAGFYTSRRSSVEGYTALPLSGFKIPNIENGQWIREGLVEVDEHEYNQIATLLEMKVPNSPRSVLDPYSRLAANVYDDLEDVYKDGSFYSFTSKNNLDTNVQIFQDGRVLSTTYFKDETVINFFNYNKGQMRIFKKLLKKGAKK